MGKRPALARRRKWPHRPAGCSVEMQDRKKCLLPLAQTDLSHQLLHDSGPDSKETSLADQVSRPPSHSQFPAIERRRDVAVDGPETGWLFSPFRVQEGRPVPLRATLGRPVFAAAAAKTVTVPVNAYTRVIAFFHGVEDKGTSWPQSAGRRLLAIGHGDLAEGFIAARDRWCNAPRCRWARSPNSSRPKARDLG